jgi:predicted glycoside hydrolase/deacetylase ChbG (UPF0249 family)
VSLNATARYLIVNADDFGQSPGVNRGIIQCFEEGIVTSASLMVRWPAAAAAAEYARNRPELSVGLHVDLGEWACRGGEWVRIYTVVPEDDAAAVADEVARQLALFRTLVGHGPTHLDSHQHVHRAGPVRPVVCQAGRTLGVPVRHFSAVHYCGDFYGQTKEGLTYPEGLGAERLIETVAALPAGITELGCHPGLGDDVESMYRTERTLEQATLCDPRIREALAKERIELRSFRDFDWRTGEAAR